MSKSCRLEEASHVIALPGPLPLALVGALITCMVWLILLVGGEDNVTRLISFSSKLKVLSDGSDGLIAVLIAVSVGIVACCSAVLPSRPQLLMIALLLSFGLSEVVLPWLNLGAFVLRYMVIIALVTAGTVVLLRTGLSQIGWLRWIGLGFLVWCFVSLAINGPRTESLIMLPIQVVIVIGMLFGARAIYGSPQATMQAANVFVGVGVFMTGLHIVALLVFQDSFLKGRFTSILPLPTSFGNSYVLFMAAMTWRMFLGGRWIVTGMLAGCVTAGVVMLLLSGTRNALLAMLVMLLVYFVVWKKRVAVVAALGLVIGALATGAFFLESDAFKKVTNRANSKESLEIREEVWKFAWQHIQEKPVIGYGLGIGTEVVSKNLPSWTRLNTHNAYLGLWLQLGIVGVMAILIMYVWAMLSGCIVLMSDSAPREIVVAVALPLATLTGLFVGGMFEENLSSRGGLQQVVWGLDICLIQSARLWVNAWSLHLTADREDSLTA